MELSPGFQPREIPPPTIRPERAQKKRSKNIKINTISYCYLTLTLWILRPFRTTPLGDFPGLKPWAKSHYHLRGKKPSPAKQKLRSCTSCSLSSSDPTVP